MAVGLKILGRLRKEMEELQRQLTICLLTPPALAAITGQVIIMQ